MIDYLLKSATCLTVLLAIYHLFLERMKMHRFNRFYLLLSLAIGLFAPLMTIQISQEAAPYIPGVVQTNKAIGEMPEITQQAISITPPADNSAPVSFSSLIIFLYGLVTGIFLTRFVGNIFRILSKISRNPKLYIDSASLILMNDNSLPHSFLNYIFINEEDYRSNRVEGQLLEHELTHVRQRHSLDILFIEILRIVFWFNPIFIFYKRAIQLNHEFLADEAVVQSYDVYAYQYLLLEKSVLKDTVALTSNLNYSITKKRLNMMIKTTSKLKTWTVRLAVVPVLAAMLFLVSAKSVSEAQIKSKSFTKLSVVTDDPNESTYFKGATIWIENKEGKFIPRKYDEMTAAEKAALPSPQLPKNVPTNEMLASWKVQPGVYAVWIDGKYINNSALAKYKTDDFPMYRERQPGKMDLRVNSNYAKFSKLINLYTNSYYAEHYIKPYSKSGKWLAVYKGAIWPGGMIDGAPLIRKYFEVEKLGNKASPGGLPWALPPFKPEKIE